MAKLKINFGDGGPQKFLLHHAEKFVFAGICAFVLWFIYSGAGAKSLDTDLTPLALKTKASEANNAIMSSKWEAVQDQRKERVDISKEVDSRTIVIEPSPYVARDNWNPPLVPRLTPRTDPKLFAPDKLKVVPLVGALATVADKDPLAVFASRTADVGKKNETKKAPTPKDKEKDKGKEKNKRPPGEGGVPPGYPAPGGPGPGRPGAEFGGMPGGPNGAALGQDFEKTLGISAAGAVPMAANAVVINAVVPYAQQWRAYQTSFSRAPGGMKMGRDMPNYLQVVVERADVTADPTADAATLKWEPLSTKELKRKEAEVYAADVPEISDPQYLDEALTHYAPPFLVTDLREALTHADVPLAKIEEVADVADAAAPKAEPGANDAPAGDEPEDVPSAGGPGGDSRIPGMRGKRQPRGGRGLPGGPGSPYGPGGPRPPGAEGGTNPYGNEVVDLNTFTPVEKKLVRFVDFDVKPGRLYRYRMQVWLEDPNQPKKVDDSPDITSLDSNAKDRLKKQEAADKASGRRVYWRKSDWSEASEPVSLPRLDRFLAGTAEPAATLKIAGVPVTTKEPEVSVLSVVWDPRLAILAPMEFKLARGGMLNGTRDIEQVHPANGTLLKIPDYRMTTNGMLLDMKGGMPFPSADRDRTRAETAPGEAVIVDSRGRIIVSIEAESVIDHHKHAPHKEERRTEAPRPGAGGDFSEFMEGEIPGYPSPPPVKKSGKGPRE